MYTCFSCDLLKLLTLIQVFFKDIFLILHLEDFHIKWSNFMWEIEKKICFFYYLFSI